MKKAKKVSTKRRSTRLQTHGLPGKGEIVGKTINDGDVRLASWKVTKDETAPDHVADMIRFAKEKDGDELIRTKLAILISTARFEGQTYAEGQAMEQAKRVREMAQERAIQSFLAVCEAQVRSEGALNSVNLIGGALLAHIIDALDRSGYTAEGKRDGKRS